MLHIGSLEGASSDFVGHAQPLREFAAFTVLVLRFPMLLDFLFEFVLQNRHHVPGGRNNHLLFGVAEVVALSALSRHA